MKQIEVVAAIIHDGEGRMFATQRGCGEWKDAGKRGQSGCLTLKEHEAARWLTKDELGSVEWLPADKAVVEFLKRKE